jgi:acyl-CoA synthetase (AMP-forming)/AMP-acid ligase II
MTLLRVTDAASYPVTVGYPVPGCEVQIVDAEGRLLPDGTEGMVRIRTPWMVDRYLNEPALTAEYFRDGWFHPGDLGRMDPEGLRLIGRTADLLNIGGTKLNAAELDEVIQSLPVVHDGYCFAVADVHGTDTLCAIVTLKPGADPASLEALRQVVTDRLGKARVPQLVYIAPRGVPRNENGKPMRRLAQAAVAGLEPIRLG